MTKSSKRVFKFADVFQYWKATLHLGITTVTFNFISITEKCNVQLIAQIGYLGMITNSYNFISIAEKYSVTSMSRIGHLGITKLI